jgi:hypothetical protein
MGCSEVRFHGGGTLSSGSRLQSGELGAADVSFSRFQSGVGGGVRLQGGGSIELSSRFHAGEPSESALLFQGGGDATCSRFQGTRVDVLGSGEARFHPGESCSSSSLREGRGKS